MLHDRRDRTGVDSTRGHELDLDELLHPALAFDHPNDVVNDPDLTHNEKRAILSSWASDACAIDSHPHLRRRPGAARAVTFGEIVDALKSLDTHVGNSEAYAVRRQIRRLNMRRYFGRGGRSQPGGEGSPLGA